VSASGAVPGIVRLASSTAVLAFWLGAAVLLAAVVAPAAFATLPSRALAGAVVGRVLPVVFVSGIAVGALAGALALAPPAAPFARVRAVAAAVLAGACAVAQFAVGPRIHRLREAIGPSIEALATDDPRRAAFGRLHALSVAWMGVGTLAAAVALILCVLAMRDRA
jgi:hypothetical protein